MDTLRNEGRGEVEKKPRYRFMITRHAERLPSGELSPEGIEHAKRKGTAVKDAEVLKAYASDHASKRAFQTGDMISAKSGIKSPLTEEQYKTKTVPDIQYDVLKPDHYHLLMELKVLIEKPTLAEAFADPVLKEEIEAAVEKNREKIVCKKDAEGNSMIDIEKLPVNIQMKIAPIRQKYQRVAFKIFLDEQHEGVKRLAMGLGHQLIHEMRVAGRYDKMREGENNSPQKDVILNTATHGLFMESLLQKAGILVKEDGTEVEGVTDWESPEIGGYLQPSESIYLDIDDPNKIPARIPVIFEGANRPKAGRVFIDRAKLEQLDKDYLQWKKLLK